MNKDPYLPERGDLIWLILDPRVGHEQSGRRPALVLSARLFSQRTGLAMICPVTSKVKGLPFEVLLSGGKTKGVILPIHLRSVDVVSRKAVFIESVSDQVLDAVQEYVRVIMMG